VVKFFFYQALKKNQEDDTSVNKLFS